MLAPGATPGSVPKRAFRYLIGTYSNSLPLANREQVSQSAAGDMAGEGQDGLRPVAAFLESKGTHKEDPETGGEQGP